MLQDYAKVCCFYALFIFWWNESFGLYFLLKLFLISLSSLKFPFKFFYALFLPPCLLLLFKKFPSFIENGSKGVRAV